MLNDHYLVNNGFRQFDKGRRFHKGNLLLVKVDGAYQLVGYEKCIVRTVDELDRLSKIIEGDFS